MTLFLIVQSVITLGLSLWTTGFMIVAIWYTERRKSPPASTVTSANARPRFASPRASIDSIVPFGSTLTITVAPAPITLTPLAANTNDFNFTPPAAAAGTAGTATGTAPPSAPPSAPPTAPSSLFVPIPPASAGAGSVRSVPPRSPRTSIPHVPPSQHHHPAMTGYNPPPVPGSYLYVFRRFGVVVGVVSVLFCIDPLGGWGIYPLLVCNILQGSLQALIGGSVCLWARFYFQTIYRQTSHRELPTWLNRALFGIPVVYGVALEVVLITYWSRLHQLYGTDYFNPNRDLGAYRVCLILSFAFSGLYCVSILALLIVPYRSLREYLKHFQRTSQFNTSHIDAALSNMLFPVVAGGVMCALLMALQWYTVALRVRDPSLVDRDAHPFTQFSISSVVVLFMVLAGNLLCFMSSPFDISRRLGCACGGSSTTPTIAHHTSASVRPVPLSPPTNPPASLPLH